MIENPFMALTFIAGPAVLTNACAIMQNSATMRYTMAITQWREFRAAAAAGDPALTGLYADAQAAMSLAERRIRFLLHGLDLIYLAVGFFGASALLGLAGAVLAASPAGPDLPVALVVASGAGGVLALTAATLMFAGEGRCARALLELQLQLQRPRPARRRLSLSFGFAREA